MATASPDPAVRDALRALLTASEEFNALDPARRREIAGALVRIAATARRLARLTEPSEAAAQPLAAALNAGREFSERHRPHGRNDPGHARSNLLSALRQRADHRRLQAIVDSNQQQLQAFVELTRDLVTSSAGFADANTSVAAARGWFAERFPGQFEVRGPEEDLSPEELRALSPAERAEHHQAERDRDTRLSLKLGALMPAEASLRTALGLREGESPPTTGDRERLVGFARQAMARNRQQMLSSMAMMGLQRLVIESGRLSASMRFHIDARSAAAQNRGSSFDFSNETAASGNLGGGGWGVSAAVKNTIA